MRELKKAEIISHKDFLDGLPLKSIYSTSEIIDIVRSYLDRNERLGMGILLSLPVPSEVKNKKTLNFFVYACPGPLSNKKLLPPTHKIQIPIDSPSQLECQKILPQLLNLDVPPGEVLAEIKGQAIIWADEAISRIDDIKRRDALFSEAVDHILQIYPKPSKEFIEAEMVSVKIYLEVLNSHRDTSFLISAYQALNPHFFEWVDSTISKN
jgi:hypothetical protein